MKSAFPWKKWPPKHFILPLSYPTHPMRFRALLPCAECCSSQPYNQAPTQQQVVNLVSGAQGQSSTPRSPHTTLVTVPGPKLGWHCCRTGTGTPQPWGAPRVLTQYLCFSKGDREFMLYYMLKQGYSLQYTHNSSPRHAMQRHLFHHKKSIYFDLRGTDFLLSFWRAGKRMPLLPLSQNRTLEMLNLTPHDRINNSWVWVLCSMPSDKQKSPPQPKAPTKFKSTPTPKQDTQTAERSRILSNSFLVRSG